MISFISSLEIINAVLPDPKIFIWIAAPVDDTTAVYLNGIKMPLANGLSTLPIKGILFFSYGPKSVPKNPCDCPILCIWVLDSFILAEELFANALKLVF